MNLILFEPDEIERPLARSDRRAAHVLTVLRRAAGDTFDAGIVNGARGKATLRHVGTDALKFSFEPSAPPSAPAPITLIVGLPRPQTARDILRDATTLGVSALHFVRTEKAEPSYARSTLWSSGEWRRHALAGAEQAFATHVPEVTHGQSLGEILKRVSADATQIALDNYESSAALSAVPVRRDVALAIGSERGWSAAERASLRAQGFTFAHLGERVLRTETACVVALALVRAKLGLL